LWERIERVEVVAGEVRGEVEAGRYDPIAGLRRMGEAAAGLERELAVAGVKGREEADRSVLVLVDRALLVGRCEVAAGRDVVTTHRGALGSRARTRLAEAERRLQLAEATAATAPAPATATTPAPGGDPPLVRLGALAHAREADRLAREALTAARQDVSGFGGGMGGAVLGGILLSGGGGFGRGPGSFGGGQTRGRMGGGGRF